MNKRPQTMVILAMSADGKIADVKRSPARFASGADKAHLERQISQVDAVIFGAGTLRAYGTSLPVSTPQLLRERQQRQQSSQPIHIVCSRSGKINLNWRFFTQNLPRWLLTTSPSYAASLERYQFRGFDKVLVVPTEGESIHWLDALENLHNLGINKLGVLGGGELVASLVAKDLIDEFWLTVCPLILGGKSAPTPVDGHGFITQAGRKLKLVAVETVEEEVFLNYRRQR